MTDILSAGLSRISASGNNGTASIAGASGGDHGQPGGGADADAGGERDGDRRRSGNITNTAVGTSTTPDPTPTNTVTVATPVATSGPDGDQGSQQRPCGSGQTISYTVTVVNLVPVASNVTLTDILSAGLSLISASGNNGTASVAGASVGATTSSLHAEGDADPLVVMAKVAPPVDQWQPDQHGGGHQHHAGPRRPPTR
ncbi:MAG: DUF11 domain-containing protein [Ramlibacter sp.]|nr:DUF11 domain-containing protein [Ramlibacter sp.]